MEAGRSLRELFAELARPGAGDPADLLREAGFGDVPHSLLTQAIVDYAATAPLEVAEHLAPFAVAHGPLPDLADETASTAHGLSLLASAPLGDAPGDDDVADDLPGDGSAIDDPAVDDFAADHVEHGSHGGDVDVDPSVLDDHSGHPTSHVPADGPHTTGMDPAGLDGLGERPLSTGPASEQHPDLGSFGVGHSGEVATHPGAQAAEITHEGGVDHDVDPLLVPDHDEDFGPDGPNVSRHQQHGTATDGATLPLDHDPDVDPHDVMDGDAHHGT